MILEWTCQACDHRVMKGTTDDEIKRLGKEKEMVVCPECNSIVPPYEPRLHEGTFLFLHEEGIPRRNFSLTSPVMKTLYPL